MEVVRLQYYYYKQPLERALELGMLEAIKEYGGLEIPEGKEQKGVDRVITALAAYFEHYHPDTDHIQPYFVDGKPAVEFTFSLPLPINHPETNLPFIYAGRFDMLGIYQGQLVVVDEKTTSQLGASWAKKWDLRGQFTGYVWACQKYNIPTIGAVVRGISFLKQTKQNPSGHGFEESIQMRPKWLIDAWYEQLLADVGNMVRAWEINWYDQDFGDTCAYYSGCPFLTLCTSPTPETWISGRYAERKWNPLDKIPYKQPEQIIETVAAPAELQNLMQKTGE